MAKLVNRPITVINNNENPLKIKFSGTYFPVLDILEIWKDTGAWWDGEQEKTFYRVNAKNYGICEIYCQNDYSEWFLYKVYD